MAMMTDEEEGGDGVGVVLSWSYYTLENNKTTVMTAMMRRVMVVVLLH